MREQLGRYTDMKTADKNLTMLDRRRVILAGGAALALMRVPGAMAQSGYPNKPVRVIVPYPPGGASDITARVLAEQLGPRLGQPVIVENRAGANGAIGIGFVAKSAADGYTLAAVASSHAFSRTLYPKLPYDPVGDFIAITQTTRTPVVLVSSATLPARNLNELVELIKASPGRYAFASSGNGSNTHIFGQWFCAIAGLRMIHAPYKGSTPAQLDLISGQVAITFDTLPAVRPHILSDKIRLIAAAGKQRLRQFPEVPTIAESGYPSFDAESWSALLAPKHTPPEIVARLNKDVVDALHTEEVSARLREAGSEIVGDPSSQAQKMMEEEEKRYSALIKELDIKLE